MTTLETERLVLRDFVITDWDTLNTMLSDPQVTQYMHFALWNEEKRRAWLEKMVQDAQNVQEAHRTAHNWAITLRSNGTLVGWLYIGGTEGECGCGYALNRPFWGHGYMTEALRAAFSYEFHVLGTRRIVAECETQNIASARVMQKCDMTYVGTCYDADFEGNMAHRHHYAISKQDVDNI